MKEFYFKDQIKVGNAGEEFIAKEHEMKLTEKELFEYDLISRTGKTVELKTDTYPTDVSRNFFFELATGAKVGGAHRAAEDEVDVFAYLYIYPEPVCYFFTDVKLLVKVIDTWIANNPHVKMKKVKDVFGKEVVMAYGYAIPRKSIVDAMGDACIIRKYPGKKV